MRVVGVALELDAHRFGERIGTAATERADTLTRGPHCEGVMANAHARASGGVDAAPSDDAAVAGEAVGVPRLEGAYINAVLRVVWIYHHDIVAESRIVPAVAVVGTPDKSNREHLCESHNW